MVYILSGKYDRHINIDVENNMNVITVVFMPHLGNKTFLIPVPLSIPLENIKSVNVNKLLIQQQL